MSQAHEVSQTVRAQHKGGGRGFDTLWRTGGKGLATLRSLSRSATHLCPCGKRLERWAGQRVGFAGARSRSCRSASGEQGSAGGQPKNTRGAWGPWRAD